MKKLLLIALLGSSGFLFSQTICTGTTEQGREAQTRLCTEEKAPANLELNSSKMVTGVVTDQTGAKFEQVAVQLRSSESRQVLRSAAASNGEFNLGVVPSGSYRLIVVKIGPSGPERLKMFDQPASLRCTNAGNECKLTVVPRVHSTDNPIDHCPPK